MINFWMLATCQCGTLARADMDFGLCRIGGYAFVHHPQCGPQLTSCDEDHCPQRDGDCGTRSEPPRGDPSCDAAG